MLNDNICHPAVLLHHLTQLLHQLTQLNKPTDSEAEKQTHTRPCFFLTGFLVPFGLPPLPLPAIETTGIQARQHGLAQLRMPMQVLMALLLLPITLVPRQRQRMNPSSRRLASQILVLPVRNVYVGLWVTVLLGQSEVNDVHLVGLLPQAYRQQSHVRHPEQSHNGTRPLAACLSQHS